MNNQLRHKAINNFEKYLFKLMNNAVLEKITKNLRKQKH